MPKTIPLAQCVKIMQDMQAKANDLEPVMAHIANALYNSTSQSFEKESSPFGEKWTPLAPSTLKKSKGIKKKLIDKGKLVKSIHTAHTSTQASIGTNIKYAAIHQFGGYAGRGHKSKIPQRAFLPIDKEGNIPKNVQEDIKEAVIDYMLEDFKS
ncbi:phage virion morphogenesis protein [Helicobacter sp. MIT 21-1697]|uniref:phage virion morphogenesis protein n=1 Tax=Helicobacter sp. MIT 21-1697 TaxID=2993733 RepID=UPI00224AA607|nr:phage virion morphogenesis protein [Helicobacter sp. MIT 21-1697]MCX2717826.1 phage virion morphogenesis protein [Helicobacter sp. MIT 21-1697]